MAEAAFDGGAMRAWAERAHALLAEARLRLDELNVFPVPDSDTGTNLLRTLTAGRAALAEVPPDAPLGDVAQAVADGALMGARGNSGIILSQYLRALGEAFADQADADGGHWALALDRAAYSAVEAMAEPVEGTALTVVRGAADAARGAAFLARGADVPVEPVLTAAVDGARSALARTPSLLSPLAERGVVDAGGAGFVLLLQALVDVVMGSTAVVPLVLTAPPREAAPRGPDDGAPSGQDGGLGILGCPPHAYTAAELEHWQAGDYEVMYVLTASDEDADLLRDGLGRIGASVGVVGGVAPGRRLGLWHVHVHTDEPTAAIGAARGAPLRQVCVRYLRAPVGGDDEGHLGVVACTAAPGLLAPLAGAGAVAVLVDPAGAEGVRAGIVRAVVDSGQSDVVVLPCGPISAEAALGVAEAFAAAVGGPRVEVLDSRGEAAVVAAAATAGQGGARRASMSDALARTRVASVEWPGAPSAADAARPEPVPQLAVAASDAVRALVRPGDEVLTVIAGRDVPPAVVDAVEEAACAVVGGLEVVRLVGGQVAPALSLGVE